MVYSLAMGSEDLRERVATNTEAIRVLGREVERSRERLHKLEAERAIISRLMGQVEELQEQTLTLVRHAAREAVSEYLKRQRAERFSNWRTYATLLSARAAIGGLIVSVILGAR